VGAALITMVFERWPILVWAGAGLLGWLAGDLLISDPAVVERIGEEAAGRFDLWAAAAGAAIVVAIGYARKRIQARKADESAARPAPKPKQIAKTTRMTEPRRPRARKPADAESPNPSSDESTRD
jgi:hypothetical protein